MIDSNGIVISGGGERRFTVVRSMGCSLPIQIFCLVPSEIDNKMKGIIESRPNTTVVDATQIEGCPFDLSADKFKALAAVCAPFKKTFVLDVGGVPIQINDRLSPSPSVYHRQHLFSVHYPPVWERHPYEDLCFSALEDLRWCWDGRPWALPPEQKAYKSGYASHWRYSWDGREASLHLKWDGTLMGGSAMEGYLSIVDFRGRKRIVIGPDFKRAEFLLRNTQAPLQVFDRDGPKWTGTWDFLGKHTIELEGVEGSTE
jgi:hypothetical protein